MNYYKILNLTPTATEKEIKKAFRKLVKKYHPDKKGNPKKLIEVLTAYNNIKRERELKKYEVQEYKEEIIFDIPYEKEENLLIYFLKMVLIGIGIGIIICIILTL